MCATKANQLLSVETYSTIKNRCWWINVHFVLLTYLQIKHPNNVVLYDANQSLIWVAGLTDPCLGFQKTAHLYHWLLITAVFWIIHRLTDISTCWINALCATTFQATQKYQPCDSSCETRWTAEHISEHESVLFASRAGNWKFFFGAAVQNSSELVV